jgi:hypothetical protein
MIGWECLLPYPADLVCANEPSTCLPSPPAVVFRKGRRLLTILCAQGSYGLDLPLPGSPQKALILLGFPEWRRRRQGEEHDFFTSYGADVVVQA